MGEAFVNFSSTLQIKLFLNIFAAARVKYNFLCPKKAKSPYCAEPVLIAGAIFGMGGEAGCNDMLV